MADAAASADRPRSGPGRLLIVGVSTRAAAESAANAGFEVTALDAFADLDQHPTVHAITVPRPPGEPFRAAAAARASRGILCDAVAYLSHLDNHPRLVEQLAAGRTLLGNAPATLRRVRRPRLVMEALRQHGCPAPEVLVGAEGRRSGGGALRSSAGAPPSANPAPHVGGRTHALTPLDQHEPEWLVKPLRSGGGQRVESWRPGASVPRNAYVQRFVAGTPASIVFVAAHGESVPIGISQQLVGVPAFGSSGYGYCGNLLTTARDETFDAQSVERLYTITRSLAQHFDLVGVNGADVIMQNGIPWTIEVNPRWSSSAELVERAYGISVFRAHADACTSGQLLDFDLARARRGARVWGKAVVFARYDVVCGDTRRWLGREMVRDIPHPGELIRSGGPVCTVFAEAADADDCRAALVARAEAVYQELAGWRFTGVSGPVRDA
jgi:predicted ATP-grasp superfamily ATP-dependent carboligase